MVQGQIFLKRGLALFLFYFFEEVYHFLHLEITLRFGKLCYRFEDKLFFPATIIF